MRIGCLEKSKAGMPAQIGGEPPNFTAGCRQRAGEEMEVEEQEAAIFDVEDDVFEAPSSSGWRKGLIGNVSNVASKLGLGGLMGTVKGGASSTPEAPKQLASPHSPPGKSLTMPESSETKWHMHLSGTGFSN